MKTKIGTVIDETIFHRLRVHAARSGRNVSDIIEESISAYLALHAGSAGERLASFERFTARPFSLSREQFDAILAEDCLDQ